MITNEEWKRRNMDFNNYDSMPSPCKCCPEEMLCPSNEPIKPECYDTFLYLSKIPAAHKYGWYSNVGFWQCLRLNLWLLGLNYDGVIE